jgi:hypothetical protein
MQQEPTVGRFTLDHYLHMSGSWLAAGFAWRLYGFVWSGALVFALFIAIAATNALILDAAEAESAFSYIRLSRWVLLTATFIALGYGAAPLA